MCVCVCIDTILGILSSTFSKHPQCLCNANPISKLGQFEELEQRNQHSWCLSKEVQHYFMIRVPFMLIQSDESFHIVIICK